MRSLNSRESGEFRIGVFHGALKSFTVGGNFTEGINKSVSRLPRFGFRRVWAAIRRMPKTVKPDTGTAPDLACLPNSLARATDHTYRQSTQPAAASQLRP